MAMLDIEYRFSDEPLDGTGIRRKTTKDMESYIRGLVFEMQSADISARFTTGVPSEGERNMVYINGRTVPQILEGLKIVMLDPDEDSCGCNGPKLVTIGRSQTEWDDRYIEDIPDVLMKNAISKVYSEMEADRIV